MLFRSKETNPELYEEWKPGMGPALRQLWPISEEGIRRSPYWRPDWRVALVAEASIRHWAVARKAHEGDNPARLVALGNTDAATFWTPNGEIPLPYIVGSQFGQVDIKATEPGAP